jgi:hypothetical protein
MKKEKESKLLTELIDKPTIKEINPQSKQNPQQKTPQTPKPFKPKELKHGANQYKCIKIIRKNDFETVYEGISINLK